MQAIDIKGTANAKLYKINCSMPAINIKRNCECKAI